MLVLNLSGSLCSVNTCVIFSDSARISINDLENIMETETPPQSPPPTGSEDVFIEMVRESGTTKVKYSKASSSAEGSSSTGKETYKHGSRRNSPVPEGGMKSKQFLNN